MKKFDIIYTYFYHREIGYFEMPDLEDTIETRYKSEIVNANDKKQAIDIFNDTHKDYSNIISVRELFATKNSNGREL